MFFWLKKKVKKENEEFDLNINLHSTHLRCDKRGIILCTGGILFNVLVDDENNDLRERSLLSSSDDESS